MDTTARRFSIMSPTPHATRPFSYAAGNAACYTLAPFRQDRAKHAGRKIPTDKPGKSGNEISLTCNAIMYGQYVILYYIVWGPSVGDPTAMYTPPLRYKGEALAAQDKDSGAQAHPDSSNTAHSGRRVLRSGGPNHSKPAVFIVFFQEIELVLAIPRVLTLWA